MKIKLVFAQVLLFVTPIVAGSAIAALPSQAVTLASSEATLKLSNFNHEPVGVRTITNANTFTEATNGIVVATAEANAIASFDDPTLPQKGFYNDSKSIANGEGTNYLGVAQSLAAVMGFDFFVEKGQTLSFDFKSLLGLTTSIDQPQYESASANGNISFNLFDNTTGSLLDYFTISGNLATLGNSESFGYDKSANITFNPSQTSFKSSFGGTQESASASVTGKYSRTFANQTSLTLIEYETNEASVKAVPEPSDALGAFLFGLIGIGYGVRSKVFGARSKFTK